MVTAFSLIWSRTFLVISSSKPRPANLFADNLRDVNAKSVIVCTAIRPAARSRASVMGAIPDISATIRFIGWMPKDALSITSPLPRTNKSCASYLFIDWFINLSAPIPANASRSLATESSSSPFFALLSMDRISGITCSKPRNPPIANALPNSATCANPTWFIKRIKL